MNDAQPNRWGLVLLPFLFLFVFSMPGSIAGMEIATFFMSLLGSLLWLLSFKIKGIHIPKFPDKKILYAMFAYWACILISGSLDGLGVRSFSDYFIEGRFVLLVVFGYMAMAMQAKKVQRFLFWFLFFQVLWVAGFAIYQSQTAIILQDWKFIKGPGGNPYRVRGFFSNTMTFSYVFGMFFMLFLGKLMDAKEASKSFWINLIGVFVIGFSLILTYTRGLWLALFISVLLCVFIVNRRRVYAMGLAGLALIVGGAMVVPGVFTRILSVFSGANVSKDIRFELWDISLNYIKENPVFGIGLRNFQNHLPYWYANNPSEFKFVGHTHSSYFELMTGLGFTGLVVYGILNFNILKNIFSAYRMNPIGGSGTDLNFLGIGTLGALLVFHFSGLTESTILDYEIMYTFSFVLVCSLLFLSLKKNQVS